MKSDLVFRTTFNYLEEVYQDCLKKHINDSRYRDLRHTLSDINNGTKVLESEEQINAYIAFYGAQHYYKLFRAFENLNLLNFVGKSLEIISYGCGPATDACVLISYLASKQLNLNIDNITLIDPSANSVRRGQKYINSSLVNYQASEKIKIINKMLDELNISDISSCKNSVKIHIFSNILDIEQINLQRLANLIKFSQEGSNYFVCVSPKKYGGKQRIDDFYSILSHLFEISNISIDESKIRGRVWSMKTGNFNDNYYIDNYQRIFMMYAS